MHKGFGLYSPHEATTFFLKTMLVSFWVGVDLIAALVMSTFAVNTIIQHGFMILVSSTILITGTVFSALFAWATGSLFARTADAEVTGGMSGRLQKLKREPYQLIVAGSVIVFILLCMMVGYIRHFQTESDTMQQLGRANVVLGKKCSEVASLEKNLFQSDEQFVMAQCLIQYDQQYAALRNISASESR